MTTPHPSPQDAALAAEANLYLDAARAQGVKPGMESFTAASAMVAAHRHRSPLGARLARIRREGFTYTQVAIGAALSGIAGAVTVYLATVVL